MEKCNRFGGNNPFKTTYSFILGVIFITTLIGGLCCCGSTSKKGMAEKVDSLSEVVSSDDTDSDQSDKPPESTNNAVIFGVVGGILGAIVIGLAACIIGEAIIGKHFKNFSIKLFAVVIGAIIYYLVLQLVLNFGLNTNDLKLFTALFVAFFLSMPVFINNFKLGGKS